MSVLDFSHMIYCMIILFAYFTSLYDQNRLGYDYFGGYERVVGGRPGYGDERSYGRFSHRSTSAYQNGIPGMLIKSLALFTLRFQ